MVIVVIEVWFSGICDEFYPSLTLAWNFLEHLRNAIVKLWGFATLTYGLGFRCSVCA